MSFQSQTASTFVKLNLTDLGRQKMALGIFSVQQVVFSDREVQYSFNRKYPTNDPCFANLNPTSNNFYNQEENKVLAPTFSSSSLPLFNFDGSRPYNISDKTEISFQISTARTESMGLWNAQTEGSDDEIGEYILDNSKAISFATIPSQDIIGENAFIHTGIKGPDYLPGFVYARYSPPTALNPNINQMPPVLSLWYRVTGRNEIGASELNMGIDRVTPNFNSSGGEAKITYYPASGATEYWNSGTTCPGPVWNLNIVRTNSVLGTTTAMTQNNSGYTSYGSAEFSGTKKYFGFDDQQRAVGFIWHKDKFTGETLGDFLLPNTTQVDLPDIMWHRKKGSLPGGNSRAGHRFTDKTSGILYDNIAKSNYTELKDGVDQNAIAVGRVYYNLKLIVITDQELLTAMSYKSNRNYTLPSLNVELSESHPDSLSQVVYPWIREGYTYYFSYYTRNDDEYLTNSSYGFAPATPCENWTKIVGKNRPDGTPYYASISFDPSGFPYLRDETNMESSLGTGWVSNQVQIIVNEIPTQDGADDKVRPSSWTAVTDGSLGSVSNTNGIYIGESGQNNIYPQFLGTRIFNLHQEDINTSSVDYFGNSPHYVIPEEQITLYDFLGSTGLTFGNEMFLNGNVQTTSGLRVETIKANLWVDKDELNSSLNGGYDGRLDDSTYITEIGILSSKGELLAIGKPTYPIRKNKTRFLMFQLEIDI